MIMDNNEEFILTSDHYLNPKQMFKLNWVADPHKIKLKKPNIEHNLDEINSNMTQSMGNQ